jgi:hypothetical protein
LLLHRYNSQQRISKSRCSANPYSDVPARRPIFITSLPRAGTTLVLAALFLFPTLATHLYRDMPFVLSPVLWSRLSGGFRKKAEMKERAHGDGMQIGYDSPEAFEEILWRAFWPEKYSETGIALWETGDVRENATLFFSEHMKKIISLRRPERHGDSRYISKNNANIARVDIIHTMFPDAAIVVPVRDPVEHALSLLRQHRNFLEMHDAQPFVCRYMRDIGHYEFGRLHRPIAFPGLDSLLEGRDPLSADYWLAYWIVGFEYLCSKRDRIIPIGYEAACNDPETVLGTLCQNLDIAEEGALPAAAALFHPPPPPRAHDIAIDPALEMRAQMLYRELTAGS